MMRLPRHRRAGFSLIEVSLSTLFVGVMLATSMRTVGSVLSQRTRTAVDARAQQAARQLLTEILARDYVEPTQTPVFGRESSEAASRSGFDDVDDYHLWDETPPTDRAGVALTGLTGWRRKVTVAYVSPANPDTTSGTDQGTKRIIVEAYENSTLRATVRAVKCSGWPRK
ncbi:MAG: hypothetical protein SH850_12800 [Planctomycetaceae bacterium]|nr:hypothetical protein [Planctomycetaceae bacterium]